MRMDVKNIMFQEKFYGLIKRVIEIDFEKSCRSYTAPLSGR